MNKEFININILYVSNKEKQVLMKEFKPDKVNWQSIKMQYQLFISSIIVVTCSLIVWLEV